MEKKYQVLKVTSEHVSSLLGVYSLNDIRYFGRAKELPGVKELFESKKKDEDEDQAVQEFYKKFTGNGPAYYGDLDEADGELLKFEKEAEAEGKHIVIHGIRC